MTASKQKNKVLHFRLWRLGESMDWKCTAQEMADEVGCSLGSVTYWAKKSGWKLQKGDHEIRSRNISTNERVAVDRQISAGTKRRAGIRKTW